MTQGNVDQIEQPPLANGCLIDGQTSTETQNGFFVPQSQWQSMCVTLKLSDREAQISRLILCGHSEQMIAEELRVDGIEIRVFLVVDAFSQISGTRFAQNG